MPISDKFKVKINDNENQNSLFGKKAKPVPAPPTNIGIDTTGEFVDDLIQGGNRGQIDITQIDRFCHLSQNRNQMYASIDTMAEDPTIAAVLETYAEDATETNLEGKIIWCVSDNPKVSEFVTFLLNTMNVDKHIYKWIYSLIKYGDCYLRLYRKSEFYDDLFDDVKSTGNRLHKLDEDINKSMFDGIDEQEDKSLKEDVNVKLYHKNDNYVHYIEMVPNPAEMYELTRFGKSYAYIQAPVNMASIKVQDQWTQNANYQYRFKKKDINLYDATNFVHASLEDDSNRTPEKVKIFREDSTLEDDNGNYQSDEDVYAYTVNRGQSLLYSSFRAWREMGLLETSLLLNRVTKSSFIRILNIEVGDMPKEQIGPHLAGIKQLMEQKTAINTGNTMSEYVNPGPIDNTIYVPTHGGQGGITTTQIGGEVDVKGLADVNYFRDKLFGALKVPKEMFGFTEDGSLFDSGKSLSILSSRYAKTVKKIQNSMIQALTDAINLMLIDKGLNSYVNKFVLQMQAPITQGELDRVAHLSERIRMIQDIMNLVGELPSDCSKLKVLKTLMANVTTDPEIVAIIQEQIDALEAEETANKLESQMDAAEDMGLGGDDMVSMGDDFGGGGGFEPEPSEGGEMPPAEPQGEGGGGDTLPTPSDLGMDFTDNTAF